MRWRTCVSTARPLRAPIARTGSRRRQRLCSRDRREQLLGRWRLIGQRVAVTVAAGEVRIRQGMREVAVHKQSEGGRLRIIDSAHFDGVAGRNGAVCRPAIVTPTVPRLLHCPRCCVLLPNTNQRSGGASDGAHKEPKHHRSARGRAGAIAALRHPRPARPEAARANLQGVRR